MSTTSLRSALLVTNGDCRIYSGGPQCGNQAGTTGDGQHEKWNRNERQRIVRGNSVKPGPERASQQKSDCDTNGQTQENKRETLAADHEKYLARRCAERDAQSDFGRPPADR